MLRDRRTGAPLAVACPRVAGVVDASAFADGSDCQNRPRALLPYDTSRFLVWL